jgi:Ca-activated chloride channel homolog
MPDWRYSRFDASAAALEMRLRHLQRLLVELLLRTNGDVGEALNWLEQLGKRHGLFDDALSMDDFKRWLEGGKTVARDGSGMLKLTPSGEKLLRASSLDAVFSALGRGPGGDHRVPAAGEGGERLPETRPWAFGDALSLLDGTATIAAAIQRGGLDDFTLVEDDLSVFETELHAACATVLLLDVSHSMVLYGEDRITPAKKVALAMAELITTRYPKDDLHVVLFGDTAWEVPLDELPYCGVGPFHTNTREGLRLARQILRRKKQPNRQIVMLTDGKPSALTDEDGRIYKNPFGLDEQIVNKTLEEAVACRRQGVPITTFMLTQDPTLVEFVERLTAANKGRAYFSRPDQLESFVFVDYVRNRKRRMR